MPRNARKFIDYGGDVAVYANEGLGQHLVPPIVAGLKGLWLVGRDYSQPFVLFDHALGGFNGNARLADIKRWFLQGSSDGSIVLPLSPQSLGAAFSIGVLSKRTASSGQQALMTNWSTTTSESRIALYYDGSNTTCDFNAPSGGGALQIANSADTGVEWELLVGTASGSVKALQRRSKNVSDKTQLNNLTATDFGSASFQLGRLPRGEFGGGQNIALAFAYNRGLSDAEVTQLWVWLQTIIPTLTGNVITLGTPSDDTTALVWKADFDSGAYTFATGLTATDISSAISLGELVFSRASTAWNVDDAGNFTAYASGAPRMVSGGILLEPARTNLFLNNLAPNAQNITVTAQAYTLSFYGPGSVTLSGAHSQTVVGLGAGKRKIYTFTPSSGTLTVTPSGTVALPQVEAGDYETTPILTAGSAVTRAADRLYTDTLGGIMSGAHTVVVDVELRSSDTSTPSAAILTESNGSSGSNKVQIERFGGSTSVILPVTVGGTAYDVPFFTLTSISRQRTKIALAVSSGRAQAGYNGAITTASTPSAVPSGMTRMEIGGDYDGTSARFCGIVHKVRLYVGAKSAPQLAALTAA